MSNLIATETPKKESSFREQWDSMTTEVSDALPPHIPVERFMRIVLTAVNGNPELLKADRRSLFESSMKAAQDGLLPDGRDGALVIYNTKIKVDGRDEWIQKVQWMPMIGGVMKKVRNSGEISSLDAQVVCVNDKFSYRLGVDDAPIHEPDWFGDRGKVVGVYAVAKLKDGTKMSEIMSHAQVETVRAISRAKDSGPWKGWWDEMARKTVLRRLAKRLPMSSDLDDLIRRDDELYEFDKDKEPRGMSASGMKDRLLAPPSQRNGFNPETINRETGEVTQVKSKTKTIDLPEDTDMARGGADVDACNGPDTFPGDTPESPSQPSGDAKTVPTVNPTLGWYKQGYDAGYAGKMSTACPDGTDDQILEWQEGWQQGKDEKPSDGDVK
jgi:recombination protein RecT